MVIDTSAIAAILFDEPEAPAFEYAIQQDSTRLLAAPSALECFIVIERRLGQPGVRALDRLITLTGLEIEAFSIDQISLARSAYLRFGKGRHKAGLNYGDCFSYALAASTGEPLLYKGNDFSQTDIATVPLTTR